jgi:hypothetical protein
LKSSQKAKEEGQTIKFTLEIELGNDVMETGSDLAAALAKTAELLRARDTDRGYLMVEDWSANDRQHSITDEYGHNVGSWKVVADFRSERTEPPRPTARSLCLTPEGRDDGISTHMPFWP